MKLLSLLVLLGAAGSGVLEPLAEAAPASSFEEVGSQIAALKPDPARTATIDNLIIRRGSAAFTLRKGSICLCEPISGRDCAAIFQGEGTFTFKAPDRVEREQLARFFGSESLEVSFTELGLIFGDSTAESLAGSLSFGAGVAPGRMRALASDLAASVYDEEEGAMDPAVAKSLLEGDPDGMFYASIGGTDQGPLYLRIDPSRSEDVQLMRRPKGNSEKHDREIVSQFSLLPPSATIESDVRRTLDVEHYTIRVRIDDGLDVEARAEILFRVVRGGEDWLDFHLYEELRVDSVFIDGAPVGHFKGKEAGRLWVRVPRSLEAGETHAIRIDYHGELITRSEDWLTIESSVYWYPQHDPMDRALFDLTYKTSDRYQLVSVGREVSTQEEGHSVVSRWITKRPVRNACFNIGFFKEHRVEDRRIPPVTILMSAKGHSEIKQALGEEGILSGRHMEQQVAADAANSLAFFQSIFGPPPDSSYYVSEIPGAHGEAFPGLIHLYWGTFQTTNRSGADQIFRAHEIAHQWWPLGVDFKTYHDQWLSEAFAEYLGLWYMQAALQDNGRFFDTLKDWRAAILGNRKFLVGSGQEAGPISLGPRTATSSTEGDYGLIIYQKGAWVLHMLRNMLLDLDTMSEERFTSMMRDFYRTYEGRSASTRDFQTIAEKHVGEDLSWFFDQWVYGTEIPTYRFSYKAVPAEGGKFRVRCRIEQESVNEKFRMYVPLLVDFGEDRFVRIRARVVGPVSEFDLPLLPMNPRRIVMNDLSSVLCEVETAAWKD